MDYEKFKLNEAIELLKVLTTEKRETEEQSKFRLGVEKFSDWILAHTMAASGVTIVFAAISYFTKDDPVLFTTVSLGTVVLIFGWLLQVLLIIGMLPSLIMFSIRPYDRFFKLMKYSVFQDFAIDKRLGQVDVPILKYVLVQFKIERAALEKRGGMNLRNSSRQFSRECPTSPTI